MKTWRRWAWIAVSLAVLGCRDESPWAPTTSPPDPDCGSCERLDVKLPHTGGLALYSDPKTDDALAQWAICVEAIVDCAAPELDLEGCVEAAPCPAPCQAAFAEQGGDVDAFEAVFLDQDGACGVTP